MIIFFHHILIVTKYVLTVISKSIFCRNSINEEFEKNEENYTNTCENCQITNVKLEEETQIRFIPPVYVQRYIAVQDLLQDDKWCGKIKKVVDFGCAELGFFPYLKHIPGLQEVFTVDVDSDILEQHYCRVAPFSSDYLKKRQEPFVVQVLNGSIADRDHCLLGVDAVICIELIEHLYPNVLEEVPFTVFGFIKPVIAIFTTPNSDFNVLFPNFSGFRHPDHKFEWTRAQFEDWANNIIMRYPSYNVTLQGIGPGPNGTEEFGCCSQMAVFIKLPQYRSAPGVEQNYVHEVEGQGCESMYRLVQKYTYPIYIDERTEQEKLLQDVEYYIHMYSTQDDFCTDTGAIHIPLKVLYPHVKEWCTSVTDLRNVLEKAGWHMTEFAQCDDTAIIYLNSEDNEYNDFNSDLEEDQEVEFEVTKDLIPEETWDSDVTPQTLNCNWLDLDTSHSWSHLVETVTQKEPQHRLFEIFDSHLDEQSSKTDHYLNSHCNIHGLRMSNSCKNIEIDVPSSNDVVCCGSSESTESNHTVEQSSNIDRNQLPITDVNSKLQTNLGLERSEQIVQNTIQCFKNNCVTYYSDKNAFKNPDLSNNVTYVEEESVNETQGLDSEKCSENALKDHTLTIEQNNGAQSEMCETPVSNCISKSFSNLDLDSVNLSGSTPLDQSGTCNVIKSNVCCGNEADERKPVKVLFLNSLEDLSQASFVGHLHNDSINITGNSSVHDLQDKSLIESCSLDEQNDKAVDSGYPNSYSVQDMDMDLTPEQVDEIATESEDIFSENSNLNGENSEYENDSSEESEHVDDNDGFLFRFRHEVVYDPIGLDVENGDVANNNRDGEGNNAVAIINPPHDNEEFPNDIIPLLAAVEDFDNDNDVILPDDIQPFPAWLLNLLGLANNGGGDLHHYILPPGDDADNLFPDEGLPDIEDDDEDDYDEVANYNDSSSSDGVEMNEDNMQAELIDIIEGEIIVPGDIGGSGEPDSNQTDI